MSESILERARQLLEGVTPWKNSIMRRIGGSPTHAPARFWRMRYGWSIWA